MKAFAHVTLTGEIDTRTIQPTERDAKFAALLVIYGVGLGCAAPELTDTVYHQKTLEDGASVRPVTVTLTELD